MNRSKVLNDKHAFVFFVETASTKEFLTPYFLMIIPYRSKYLIFVYSIFLYILNCDIKIHGKPHKKNKTYLILANHYTALDYFVLRWIFPCSYTVVKMDLLSQRKRTSGSVGLMYIPKDVEGQIPVPPYDRTHLIYLSSNIQ